MADPTAGGGTEGLYVLIKRGLYYRPQAMGYTGVLAEAGRYTEQSARAHAENGVTMQLASEADEFSPQCWPETQIKMLRADLACASAEQARVEAERNDYRDDSLRLHREKMDQLDRALVAEARVASLPAERDRLKAALDEAEACLSIIEPRTDRAEYLRTLETVRSALKLPEAPDAV